MGRMTTMPQPTETLPGRGTPLPLPERHFVNGNCMTPPFPASLEIATFGMGCFWGAERLFWEQPGVYSTEIAPAPTFYYAEEYHQQYLAKNPDGYCGIGAVGIACPAGLGVSERAAG